MRGKHIFIITALLSILMLSACGQKRLRYSRYSNRLNHYEERLRKTVERSLRKRHAVRNDGARRYHEKYKVSDDDVDKELQKQKINTETNLKRIEKQWFKR